MFLHPAQKQGNKFQNPVTTEVMSGANMFTVLKEYITNKNQVIPAQPLGPFHTDKNVYKTPAASGLRITWIGHSSSIIEIDGNTILVDPVWSDRASFTSLFGPKRFFKAPLALDQLPPLALIIISHDHYDHLDKHAIKHFASASVPFFCSLGVGQYLQQWGIAKSRITEMNWMDAATINNLSITALPARHFSGRSLTNRFETLWSSFAIKGSSHNIYFGADSGWYDGFAEIGNAYGPFDLTMLEIGAYNKHWADIHMGPNNASNAHLALKGTLMMPVHWGTFNLALHPWKEPIEILLQNAKEKNIELFIPAPGTPTEVTGKTFINYWWQ